MAPKLLEDSDDEFFELDEAQQNVIKAANEAKIKAAKEDQFRGASSSRFDYNRGYNNDRNRYNNNNRNFLSNHYSNSNRGRGGFTSRPYFSQGKPHGKGDYPAGNQGKKD